MKIKPIRKLKLTTRERKREMKVIIEKRERNLCVAHFRAPPKSVILCYKHHHILSQETRQLCMKEKERRNKLENRTLLQKNKRKYNKKKTIMKNKEKKTKRIHKNIHTYII